MKAMDKHTLKHMVRSEPTPPIQGQVGDKIMFDLPRLPMTADTEFVSLKPDFSKAKHIISDTPRISACGGEGRTRGAKFVLRLDRPGKGHIQVFLHDAETGKRIEGIDPIDFTVEAS